MKNADCFLWKSKHSKNENYETNNRVIDVLFLQFEKQFIRDDESRKLIKDKRSKAWKKHKWNQHTLKLEQNGTSVPKLEQNGTNGTVSVSVSVSDSVSVSVSDKEKEINNIPSPLKK